MCDLTLCLTVSSSSGSQCEALALLDFLGSRTRELHGEREEREDAKEDSDESESTRADRQREHIRSRVGQRD